MGLEIEVVTGGVSKARLFALRSCAPVSYAEPSKGNPPRILAACDRNFDETYQTTSEYLETI